MRSEKRKVKSEALEKSGAKNFTFGNFFSPSRRFKGFSLFVFHFSLFFVLAFSVTVSAQEEMDEDMPPPPLKIISKEEKSSLEAVMNVTGRTKLSLELMENRLKRAEDFGTRSLYGEMYGELGGFNALVDNALVFLNKNNSGRGKVFGNFKRLELSLRQFIPRIELIRRDLPAKYEFHIRNLIKNIRAARSKAVAPFFDDSIVPNNKNEN